MKETLNLLPAEAKAVEKKRDKFYYLFIGVGAYILLMTGLWVFKVMEVRRFDNEIKRLEKQKAELQQKIAPQTPVRISPSVDAEILNAVERTPRWSRILSDISVIVPEDVWLSSIESREDKGARQMNIKGFSASQLGVASLISALESSQYFQDVEIIFSQKGDKDISFELRMKLKWT